MTGHRVRARVASAMFVLLSLCASGARAESSYLDGLTLIMLDTKDIASLHAARAFVQENGGRIGIMVPPSTMIGWVDPAAAPRLVGRHGIRDIRWTETGVDVAPARDDQTLSAIQTFNNIVSGRYEQREMEEMAASAGEAPRGGEMTGPAERAFPHPVIDADDVRKNLELQGLDTSRFEGGQGLSFAPGSSALTYGDNMTGTVAVTFFFVESDGTGSDPDLYTWTPEAMQQYLDATFVGTLWWVNQAAGYRDCWVSFLINHFSAFEARCHQWVEPVLHDGGFVGTWSANVLTKFGYTTGNHFSKGAAFDNWQKATYQTNSAYAAFIAYNPVGAPSQFTDGLTAAAWLYGPYFWSLFRIQGFTKDQVISHESGHIFGACDEYAGGCGDCVSSCSIHGTPNGNCEVCAPIPRACMMRSNENNLCQYTRGMIGWDFSTPCAPAPPAPLPAPTVSGATGASALQGGEVTFGVTGTNFVAGVGVDLGPDVFVHQTTLVNSTTLSVWASVFNAAPDGTVDIVVRNRDGQTATLADGFQILPTLKHYYSPTGGNVFPYTSAANAGTSLTDVMGAAATGDTILVPTMTFSNFSLNVARGVTLQGAWNSSFTTRNLVSGKTVLQLSGIVDVYPGVTGAALDGFVIEGGDGKHDFFPADAYYAGAVRVVNASAGIRHCEIRTSVAGPASELNFGGAVYGYGSTVDISNTYIHDNTATRGGAVFLEQCSGQLTGNTIAYNQVVTTVTYQPDGAGVYLKSCTNVTLTNNLIHHNTGGQNGGGILAENCSNVLVDGGDISYHTVSFAGGGIAFKTTTGTIRNVMVRRNHALLAGGVSVGTAPSAVIEDSRIEWNSATLGGGVTADGTSLTVRHNIIVGNSAPSYAGAMALSGASAGSVTGNTLDRNACASGTGGINLVSSTIEVFNNIIANTTGVGIGCSGSPPTLLAYNDVVNASGGSYSGCVAGTGSIASAPEFTDTVTGDYRLAVHSPCIDAGRPGALYNDPDGSRGDMGVYGAHAFTMEQPAYVQGAAISAVGGTGGDLILRWNHSPAPDLAKYAVYASAASGFVPGAATFLSFVNAPDTLFVAGTVPAPAAAYYRVNAVDMDGHAGGYSNEATVTTATPVLPRAAFANRLFPNVPNPFNPVTEIRFELADASDVTLAIYDIAGRRVRVLDRGARPAGEHAARWDGRDDRGVPVASGVYFYRLDAGAFSQTRKLTLLK